MTILIGGRRARRTLLLGIMLCSSTAALADHAGPSGLGSGGGLSVFSPDALDAGSWATGLRFVFTKPAQRSDAELEALAGQHIHAHNTRDNVIVSAAVAYGMTHHLTLSAELPYVRRDRLREGEHGHEDGHSINMVSNLGTVAGVGDLSLLAKYRLTAGDGPGVALIGGIKVPTGYTHERSDEGDRLETEHQPGTGSWDPIVGASAAATVGGLQWTASALYQISGNGAQHTRLGDRFQGGIALSHRFGGASAAHAESHNHHHGDELDEHHDEARRSSWDACVELAGEWEGRQKVDEETEQESGGAWAYVAPGLRFNAKSGWSAGASFALPVWQHIRASHPDNRYRLTLSVGRAF